MKSFTEHAEEARRLQLLQLLEQSNGYRANEVLLRDALEVSGFEVSSDRVTADLAWLAEQGLIGTREFATGGNGVIVAELTTRGVDVARGSARHPGVKRPRP